MNSKKEVQHVYLVGAKSLGAYGGYETFVYKLTEYHQNKENIKYHVACKANGDGCMDESKFDGVTKINDHEFEFHNAHCFKIDVPQIGPAQAIYYDVAALKACCEHIKKNHIPHPIVYIMACRIGPFASHFYREIHALDVVNQGMQEKQSITVRCMDIEDLEKQAEAIRVEQIKLYESYADGVLLRDAYIEKKKVLSEKLAALQDSIRTEKEEQECADELDEEIRALTKQANEKTYIGGLTKECVDAFVSMVYLYDDQTMKIEFNCEDVIRRALEKYGA